MNQVTAYDPMAHEKLCEMQNQIVALAQEVRRIAVALALDEEALDRIIDNLPPLAPNTGSEEYPRWAGDYYQGDSDALREAMTNTGSEEGFDG